MNPQPMTFDCRNLLDRALMAYFRSGGIDQPSNESDLIEVDGRVYVRLVNCHGILAAYRMKRDGTLRRLNGWPERFRIGAGARSRAWGSPRTQPLKEGEKHG